MKLTPFHFNTFFIPFILNHLSLYTAIQRIEDPWKGKYKYWGKIKLGYRESKSGGFSLLLNFCSSICFTSLKEDIAKVDDIGCKTTLEFTWTPNHRVLYNIRCNFRVATAYNRVLSYNTRTLPVYFVHLPHITRTPAVYFVQLPYLLFVLLPCDFRLCRTVIVW